MSQAKLRYSLYDSQGVMLLAAGAEVTMRLRSLLDRRGVALVVCASLKVVEGPRKGLEIPIEKDWITLGRRPSCDVLIDSEFVSGMHCRIYRRDGQASVKDLKSTNGTFVNGHQIEPAEPVVLADGDAIQIGDTVFRVQVYFAVKTDNAEDQRELDAWILSERGSSPAIDYRGFKTIEAPRPKPRLGS